MSKEYYTVEELSELLHVHWQTILNYIRSGELEAVKLGKGYRISKIAFDEFIKKRTTGSKK
jgi:excisionase family DNA binding protein